MLHDFDRLRCPNCGRFYKNKDSVYVDEYNTVIHMKCYFYEGIPLKDQGTYQIIVRKYGFI